MSMLSRLMPDYTGRHRRSQPLLWEVVPLDPDEPVPYALTDKARELLARSLLAATPGDWHPPERLSAPW